MKVYNQPTNLWPLDCVTLLILWIRKAQRRGGIPQGLGYRGSGGIIAPDPKLGQYES